VYTEEKLEDEEDMRERMQNLMKREAGQRTLSESEALLQEIFDVTEDDEQMHPLLMDVLRRLKEFFQRDIEE
jgi:diaphanous 1